ncbi:MAG: helix-turn-helix domain-containing protein [Lachnotalea sp.]
MNRIGTRIKQRRLELKLTQNQIKEFTGISTGNLSDIERSRSLPSASALIGLAEILNCSTDWLLTGNSRICDTNKISDLRDENYEANNLFTQLTKNDQEEILDIMRLKISKYKKGLSFNLDSQNNESKMA